VDDSTSALAGLRGWLAFLSIGLWLRPLWVLTNVAPSLVAVFTNGSWETLTNPTSPQYHPLWKPTLGLEVVSNCVIVVGGLALLVLFYQRSPRFPRWFIGLAVFVPLFVLADAWLYTRISPNEPFWDPSTIRAFSSSLVGGLIWVPYILMSKRVKATFVPHE